VKAAAEGMGQWVLESGYSYVESNFCPVKAENKGFMPTNKQLTHQYITLNENKTKTQDYDLLNK
jgi:hypothetical protein